MQSRLSKKVKRNDPLKLFAALLSLMFILALLPCHKASAEIYRYYSNPDTGYEVLIEDGAGLMTEDELVSLASQMALITAYGNVGFASTNSTSYSTEEFAAGWLATYLGQESSVLFLIDMGTREIRVEANNGSKNTIGGRITTSYANTITDNVYTFASNGNYYGCASTAFEQIYTILEGGRIAQPLKYITNAFFALALGMIICYIIACNTSKARRTTDSEMLMYAAKNVNYTPPKLTYRFTEKKYHPRSSSSGGGGGGGGGGGSHGGSHGF